MAKPIRMKERLVLAMPIEELWPLISNTQRVNALVGLPPTAFNPETGPDGNKYLRAETRFFRIPLHWQELPFEWVAQRFYRVERVFDGTPLSHVVTGATLEPLPDGRTAITVMADIEPRNILGRLLTQLVLGRWNFARTVKLYRAFEANYGLQGAELQANSTPVHVNKAHLAHLVDLLRKQPVDTLLVDRLLSHIQSAPDDEVREMRPFVLADVWDAPRIDVLRLFLYGTRVGLLDMEWVILCPNCRVTKAQYTRLADMRAQSHCDTCNIRYDVTFDDYVELRFNVNAQVRDAVYAIYCVGGPFMTPHIIAQARVPAGYSRTLALGTLTPGTYRLRTRPDTVRMLVEVAPDGAANATISVGDADQPVPENILLAPDDPKLTLKNRCDTEILVILERDAWGNQGASAALVTGLPEFRQHFSSEVLAPGVGIAVRSLTFLFTDLKDSTALYERMGNSPAYARVHAHFARIQEIIADHDGSLIKTIGDAVMAIFVSPRNAVKAGIAVQKAIAELNDGVPEEDHLCLKMGLHSGPALAVTANTTVDYFGNEVNIASRVQGWSVGGDIVLTDAVAADPGVREVLAVYGGEVERFEATLKGITLQRTLYRFWPMPAIWNQHSLALSTPTT